MRRYVAFDVYENLHKMLEYRSINIPHPPMLDQKEFSNKINNNGYVLIDANTGRGKTIIIQINEGSEFGTKAPEFKKLMKLIPDWRDNLNVIFVSNVIPSNHIIRAANTISATNRNYYVELLHYDNFIIEIPKHVAVPRHEIVKADEVLKDLYMTPHNFPKIYDTDPPVIWIGGRPGEFCRIYRLSEVAGETIAYRFIVKNPSRII